MNRDRSHCPVNYGLEIFGDKWTLLIIRDLILFKKKTYGELKESPEGIATNILADRLNLLESEEIITKTTDQRNNKVYLYSLTKKGLDLLPIMLEISLWGAKYDAKTAAPPHLIKRIKKDRDKVIKDIITALKSPTKNILDV
ncbi:MAG: DNA-binding HxlR family transcriptional regulator [Lysobacterales bacterium]|jgi:DNA-binding HxlR family transcriptional regulator